MKQLFHLATIRERRWRRPLQVDKYCGGRHTALQAVLALLPQPCGRWPLPALTEALKTVHMRLLRTLDDRDPLRYEDIMDAAAEKEGFDQDVWIDQPFNTRLLQHACQLAERTRPRWVDEKNYIELTRPWYSKALPFPYNYYYPGKYEKEAKNMMSALFGEDEEFSALEANVYSEGEKCLNDLSTRLGENDFFFGSHPTSLDAKVYAYLAPLLKAPFPNAALQNHLKACDNLLKFVVRVSHRYFPKAVQDYEMKKLSENNERAASKESDFPNKRRNQILAGLFATVAMTGYALSTGLVGVKLKDDDDDDSEELAEYQDLFENSENTDS
ncbi:metaxin-1 isoform X1 [Schistocerca nitens]|uniref:metaxin-1 isoform X1 n=1 Tax=Schistocerca nitens TaxID=7011 RepID=UPI00211883AC|nr:metaxin-1 isoform X1 [Schistocerca nitens]